MARAIRSASVGRDGIVVRLGNMGTILNLQSPQNVGFMPIQYLPATDGSIDPTPYRRFGETSLPNLALTRYRLHRKPELVLGDTIRLKRSEMTHQTHVHPNRANLEIINKNRP